MQALPIELNQMQHPARNGHSCSADNHAHRRPRILLVDDSKAIHDDFRKILAPDRVGEQALASAEAALFGPRQKITGPRQYEIDSVYQGDEAVALTEQALTEGRPYEMAFIDVRMPPGMDGIETTRRLWEMDPDLQVVICTAYSDYSWDEMLETLGHSDRLVILKKPFDMLEVLQLASALTEKWRLTQANRRRMGVLEAEVAERTAHLQEANNKLQAEIAFGKRREQILQLQYDISRILGDSEGNGEEVAAQLLERICRGTTWDVSELWTFDRKGQTLRRMACWHGSAAPFREFCERSKTLVFPSGKGLPGGVWETGEPCWIANLEQGSPFTRAAAALDAGLRSVLAIPIRAQGETVGVLQFFCRGEHCPEEYTVQMCGAIGSLMGQSIQKRKLEDQLRQSQKMDAIGHLAGGVAHDFNNILTVIMGFAQILRMSPHLDPEASDCLNQVFFASERAANLVRQLLTFSRKQAIQPKPLDLNVVLNNLAKMLRRVIGEDIALTLKPAATPASVYADEGMMEQVLMNLSVNARDAMPKGGRLVLQTEAITLTESSPRTHADARPGEFICLSVTDNGCGIPQEHLSRIFEPFFTTKEAGQGTGLGLSTVYGIVKQHKGWIEVASELNAGTTFRLFLPRLEESTTAPEKPASALQTVGGNETLLVVEDEPAVRTLAKRILERRGYHVLEAGSGHEALELWRVHQQAISLVLTDVIMPEGMSGRDLLARLVVDKPSLKFIYSTGYNSEQSKSYTGPIDPMHMLAKPYEPRQLLEAVRACLDHPATPLS